MLRLDLMLGFGSSAVVRSPQLLHRNGGKRHSANPKIEQARITGQAFVFAQTTKHFRTSLLALLAIRRCEIAFAREMFVVPRCRSGTALRMKGGYAIAAIRDAERTDVGSANFSRRERSATEM